MPRILLALLIGAALGVSGAIFQALTRNPLGSPDVIGFDFGAYTGALIAIAVLGGGYYTTSISAVVGGLATAVVVYLLSYKNGLAGFRLIIVGIAVSAVLSSVCQWIILKIKLHQAITASVWQQGSLNGLEWAQVYPVARRPRGRRRDAARRRAAAARSCRWVTTRPVPSASAPSGSGWPTSGLACC